MFKFKQIDTKYKSRIYDVDDLVPFNHIKESIKELSLDINKIERIILENKDKDIVCVRLCAKLNAKLRYKRDYFEKKYENIQHLNRNEDKDDFVNYYTDQF